MEKQLMLSTKIFGKCRIITQNPVYKELFLVLKKTGFYVINLLNKSIKKVPFDISYDMEPIEFSSNGNYFVIIKTDCPNQICVFDSKTLKEINSFHLSTNINYSGFNDSDHEIELKEIDFFVVYNEYLICNVNYLRYPYLRDEYGPELLDTGMEVYNIITGELVANDFRIKCSKLYIISGTIDTIHCTTNNKENYILTPHLELKKLDYPELNKSSLYYFGQDIIYFSIIPEKHDIKLYSTVIRLDKITKTQININFRLTMRHCIFNVIYVPKYKCFMVGLLYGQNMRILVLNNNATEFICYFDINTNKKYYFLDDDCIIYTQYSMYNHNIYSTYTPFKTIEHFKTAIHENNEYFLPDELIDRLIYFF